MYPENVYRFIIKLEIVKFVKMRISIMQMACVYEPNAKNSYSRFDVEYVHVSTKTLNFALSLQNILQSSCSRYRQQ